MNAQELTIQEGGEGQGVECFHASFPNIRRIFDLAFLLEGEVLCQMPALNES